VLDPVAAAIESALAAHLPAALPTKRWFAGRTRVIATSTLADLFALDGPDSGASGIDAAPGSTGDATWLAIVDVGYAGGGSERYTLPLVTAAAPDSPQGSSPGGLPRIGTAAGLEVFDASLDPDAIQGLIAACAGATPVRSPRGGTLRGADVSDADAKSLHSIATPRSLGAEQSHTSFVAGEIVFKLYRRVAPGVNPEIEAGRFLRGTAFRAAPRLVGSLAYVDAAGVETSLAVLQKFVRSRGDGWSHVLRLLRAHAGSRVLEDEARALGGLTADMHGALASRTDAAGFMPVPGTADHWGMWRSSYAARAARVEVELGAALGTLPPAAAGDARAMLGALGNAPRAIAGGAPPFELIRVHGDYHLGQTLRTDEGYVVTDFEGEPSRTIEERRAPNAALKDVAGMLRSFDYAVAVALGEGDHTPAAPLRAAFLAAYRARSGAARFLPTDSAAFAAWLAFFELDKALYEIEYELHHRPEWLWIPLAGARRLVEAAGA
jgi:maltose alpha-D-glucosyltransferase/alpha-amylase